MSYGNYHSLPTSSYTKALEALENAHKACYGHSDRPLLGMSHGPFSGVNMALGIIAELEDAVGLAQEKIARLEQQLKEKNG